MHYAAGIPANTQGKPVWVVTGQVSLNRETYQGDESRSMQQFWQQPHSFFIPAYTLPLDQLGIVNQRPGHGLFGLEEPRDLIPGDPDSLRPYQTWFNTAQQRLKFALPDATGQLHKMVIQYGPESLVTPFIALPDYIDMVLMWLLIFGLAFQLPLVTMAVVRVGVVSIQSLSRMRRYVYMGLAIVSAMLMPDLFSVTLALMVPLCLLYEFGLLLARMQAAKAQ